MRLIEEDPSYSTFSEAYENHCARTGKETDLPIVKFKQLCCTEQGVTSDPQGHNRESVSRHDVSVTSVTSVQTTCYSGDLDIQNRGKAFNLSCVTSDQEEKRRAPLGFTFPSCCVGVTASCIRRWQVARAAVNRS